jgi:predicted negative regulator of RcsB-dependent stress response
MLTGGHDTIKVPTSPEVFVARITRKELKSDKFALEVGHTVTFFEEHGKEIAKYGAIALAVLAIILGYIYYARHQRGVRQETLSRALQAWEAPVGPANPNAPVSFPTQEAKNTEAIRLFTEVTTRHAGSDEAQIADYYLAAIAANQGKLAEAEKRFKQVADTADEAYASLAKLSLAQILFSDGRAAEGEKILRDLMEHPTLMVSKEHATIALARALAKSKPSEAKKLVEPLRTIPGQAGQVAITLYGEIP